MSSPRRISAVCAAVLLAAATQASTPHAPNAGRAARTGAAPDACALLTQAQVSAALEVPTLPGKHLGTTSTAVCIWSSDADASAGRRVTLSIIPMATFDRGKDSPIIHTEPAQGVGDEAYFEVFKADSPFLVVRKGNAAFTVRIVNGLKLKAFTLEQERSKEVTLAQAVVKGL